MAGGDAMAARRCAVVCSAIACVVATASAKAACPGLSPTDPAGCTPLLPTALIFAVDAEPPGAQMHLGPDVFDHANDVLAQNGYGITALLEAGVGSVDPGPVVVPPPDVDIDDLIAGLQAGPGVLVLSTHASGPPGTGMLVEQYDSLLAAFTRRDQLNALPQYHDGQGNPAVFATHVFNQFWVGVRPGLIARYTPAA